MNRILWIDDEVDLLQPYIIYLKSKEYDVVTATNGDDAIRILDETKPDIVFLDENMPGMTGLETLQEIKRLHPEVPVVMITKSEEEHIMEQAIGEQIADYLIKPVNPSQILLCLKKHIHQQAIVAEHVQQNYRQEWSDITYMIDTASTIEEWQAIERTLTKWDLELENNPMRSLIDDQRTQANAAFGKWIAKNYEKWFEGEPISPEDLVDQPFVVVNFERDVVTKYDKNKHNDDGRPNTKYLVSILFNNEPRKFWTGNQFNKNKLEQAEQDGNLPFFTSIKQTGRGKRISFRFCSATELGFKMPSDKEVEKLIKKYEMQ